MIPQTAEYALRAVVWLAGSGDKPRTSKQIAEGTRVPPRYLYRVLQTLTQARLVRSQPGPGGGYSLARPAQDMTMLDVIRAIGPIQRIETCPLGLSEHNPTLCPLHQELDSALAHVEEAFARVMIARFLEKDRASGSLCESGQGS